MKQIPSLITVIFLVLFSSCKHESSEKNTSSEVEVRNPKNFINKGHKLVYELIATVGTYEQLRAKHDVVYTYTYMTPDNKSDVSTEKYIFANELSYGAYGKHERTLPGLAGVLEQGYDGKEYWLKADGNIVNDVDALKRVQFNRPTNFYWFTMFQKLLDPGLHYTYLGEQKVDDQIYDIVKITFELDNDKPTDIYQLYINSETGLVDQFLFTVADFGVIDTPYLMQLDYEEIDGFLIPTQRKYKTSNWNADVSTAPWTRVTWSDIRFDTGLSETDFKP